MVRLNRERGRCSLRQPLYQSPVFGDDAQQEQRKGRSVELMLNKSGPFGPLSVCVLHLVDSLLSSA